MNIKGLKKYIVGALVGIVLSGGDTLYASENHPIYTEQGIVMAAQLDQGGNLISDDGMTKQIADIIHKDTLVDVYDINIEGEYGYYIGDQSILVAKGDLCSELNARPNLTAALDALPSGKKGELMKDLGSITDPVHRKALMDVLDSKPKGVEAWDLIKRAIPNSSTTKLALDPNTVESLADIIVQGSPLNNKFGNSLNGILEDVLSQNRHLNCPTCEGTFFRGPNLGDYLKDVEFVLLNFNPGTNISDRILNWSKRRYLSGGDIPVDDGHLSEAHQYIYFLRKKGIVQADINKIDGAFLDDLVTSKKFDIELVNGPPQYYELKNKNYADMQTLPSSDADQVLSATGAFSKIDNIEDYEWTAYIRRFGENADSEEAKTILKDLWKARFENNTLQNFDVIWNNTNLRNSLLNNPSDEVQGLQRFTNLISEHGNPNIPNPKLYSFIKAE